MHKNKSLNSKLINTLFCSSIKLKKVGASYKCIPCHCKKMEQDGLKSDSNSESDSESELTVLKTLNEKTKDMNVFIKNLWTASIDNSKEIITLENSSDKDKSIRKKPKLSKSDISVRKKPKMEKSEYYFKCAFCVEELQDAKTLKIHIESKHSEDLFKFPCGDCEFNAEGPKFLKQHQNEKKHGPYKNDVSNNQAGSSNVVNKKNILDKKNTQGFQNIKDKNYRGLLNQTKSNIPKEKENESKKEIEVITIEDDYEPEDSDESLIKYQVKLKCHNCSKKYNNTEFEAYTHQSKEHNIKFPKDMNDFSIFRMKNMIAIDDDDDDTKNIGLYINTSYSKQTWEKLGICKFQDIQAFKNYLKNNNVECQFDENTLVDKENVTNISLAVKSRKKKKRKYTIFRMKNFHLKNRVKIKKRKKHCNYKSS